MSKGEVNSGGLGGTGDEHRQWTGRAEGSQGADLGLLCDQLALVSMPPPPPPSKDFLCFTPSPLPLWVSEVLGVQPNSLLAETGVF